MKERTFDAGTVITEPGQSGVGFFLIASGSASVTASDQDRGLLQSGDYFGEIALIDDGPRTARVVAETELHCYGLTAWVFRPFVQSHPEVAWSLLTAMAQRVPPPSRVRAPRNSKAPHSRWAGSSRCAGGSLAKVPRIPTAPIAAGSLIGGYLVARTTRVRPLGAVPLVIGGSWCTKQWRDRAGAPAAGGLLAIFLGAFGGSHPLAKRIGPWLSVISVAALSGLASWLMADRRR